MQHIKQPEGVKEGIYFNLSNEDYHNDPAIGSTDIKNILESPLEYWHNSALNPNKEIEQTDSLKYGSALHCYLMERHKFDEEFVVLPECSEMQIGSPFYNNAIKQKDFYDNFQLPKTKTAKKIKYIGNKPTITEKEFKRIKEAVEYLRSRKLPTQLLSGGYPEVSIFWRDKETGLMCKCRHDYLNLKFSVDYKSICDLKKLNNQIANYKYHISADFYIEGLYEIKDKLRNGVIECDVPDQKWLKNFLKNDHDNFIFIFQEKKSPYRIRCRALHKEVKQVANDNIRIALNAYKENLEKYGLDKWEDNKDQEILVLDLYDLPYIGTELQSQT